MLVSSVALVFLGLPVQEAGADVPVTIKELDVSEAIREFNDFQRRLGQYRDEITEGRSLAQETAQIMEDLRRSASAENDFNEEPILEAVTGYIDGVISRQVDLVDFLESQRYRISYYANKMASSIRPEHLALLFGTEEQNEAAITSRVRSVESSRTALTDFVDSLPDEYLDKDSFRPKRDMPRETRKQLDGLLYYYQQERNALDFAKRRLQLVRSAKRRTNDAAFDAADIDTDLLVGQMFGALDRIRLQMSMDLLYLENLLSGFSRSARTQEILEAFQNLVELQGDMEGPSPELGSILDWLQDTSTRRLSLSAVNLSRPGLDVPRYSDLLREAYQGSPAGE